MHTNATNDRNSSSKETERTQQEREINQPKDELSQHMETYVIFLLELKV